jgi:hypothetical protein
LRATSINPTFIEELEDDEGVEQHFVEEQTMEKDIREENIMEVEEHLLLEIHVEYNKPKRCKQIAKAQRRAMEMERREVEVVVKRR